MDSGGNKWRGKMRQRGSKRGTVVERKEEKGLGRIG